MCWLIEGCRNTRTTNYGDLVTEELGKTAGIVLNTVFIIGTFGAMSIYLIVCSQTIPKILLEFGVDKEFCEGDGARIYTILVLTVLLFPLALKRKLKELTFFSFLGVISVLYVILVSFFNVI